MQNKNGDPSHQLLRYGQYVAKITRIMGIGKQVRGNLILPFKGQRIGLTDSNYKT